MRNKLQSIKKYQNQRFSQFYRIKQELGKGCQGFVYRAQPIHNTLPKSNRAVKKIQKNRKSAYAGGIKQINYLQILNHPNIMKAYQAYQDEQHLYIISELYSGGELFSYLETNGPLSEHQARIVFKQMLNAVSFCHQNYIIHRDLKPQNFLLVSSDSLQHIKLIDFGSSIERQEIQRQQKQLRLIRNRLIGTSYYISPESIIDGIYNQKTDVWSLGVILYILLTLIPPFDGQDDDQIIEKIQKQSYTLQIPQMNNVSPQCKNLIKSILKPSLERLTLHQIYTDPWIQNNSSN